MNPENTLMTADNVAITYNERSDDHMAAHPEMLAILDDIVGRITFGSPNKTDRFKDVDQEREGDTFGFEIDMGRVVGTTICVEAAVGGMKLFTKRPRREIPTRVVTGVAPKPSQHVVVWIRRYDDDGLIEFRTAYVGRFAPREPSSPYFTKPRTPEVEKEFLNAFTFWSSHALIHDGKTETWESIWAKELIELKIL